MGEGYQVDQETLTTACSGVQTAIDELNSHLPAGAGSFERGEQGRGLTLLNQHLGDLGDDTLATAVAEWHQRGDEWLRQLISDGHDTAQALQDVAKGYESDQEKVAGEFSDVLTRMLGFPSSEHGGEG